MKSKVEARQRRVKHIRKTVSGTEVKPRVFVFKSNRYFHTGVANDEKGIVILGAQAKKSTINVETLAKDLAAKLKKIKVDNAVFDRSGYKYHGLVAKFVESLRTNGIKI